ncbi:hypothetical protein BRADI_1g70252v3 [Brachypodium distachyon]|uniref:Uncharacterized protein n=1 Tax=Brachypodium distachyon TaxID=15368 RepID=A0A2K2DUF6_BRADI|nr:hypothetical protein BRADI_1g70252v3 [Brachypodium distachyon]
MKAVIPITPGRTERGKLSRSSSTPPRSSSELWTEEAWQMIYNEFQHHVDHYQVQGA